MSDEQNHQFFFDRPVDQLIKPAKTKKVRKPLTVTGGIVIGSLVGSLLGGGIAVGGYYLGTAPTPIIVNDTKDVNWVSAASARARFSR